MKVGGGPRGEDMAINPGHRSASCRVLLLLLKLVILLLLSTPTTPAIPRMSTVELTENSYTQRMLLTIENVRPKDFGTYACVTRNSLGEVSSPPTSYCYLLIILPAPAAASYSSSSGAAHCAASGDEDRAEPHGGQCAAGAGGGEGGEETQVRGLATR